MTIHYERQVIPIRRLASGAQLSVPLFRFKGAGDKKVYIQANIHGPEIAGIGAAHVLIDKLKNEAAIHGEIVIVPSINPVGLDSKISGYQVGYVDLNESVVGNFNRIYQMLVTDKRPTDPDDVQKVVLDDFVQAHLNADVETIRRDFKAALRAALTDVQTKRSQRGARFGLKLAFTIQDLVVDADYLIDLHTAGKAALHVFTFEELLPHLPYFGIRNVIQLADDFDGVLDEAFLLPYVRLQKAFRKAGREIPFGQFDKEAYTLELGSADTISQTAMETDAERVMNYLRYKGILEGQGQPAPGPYYVSEQRHYQRYNAPTGGLVLWHKNFGDWVEAGETLCTILCAYNRDVDSDNVEVPIIATHRGIVNNLSESQVVHEGMSLCSVLTHLKEI